MHTSNSPTFHRMRIYVYLHLPQLVTKHRRRMQRKFFTFLFFGCCYLFTHSYHFWLHQEILSSGSKQNITDAVQHQKEGMRVS